MVTDEQVRLLRQKIMEGKKQETAAAAAGMTERSARKWQRGPLPSETKAPRWWRTRVDPLVDVRSEGKKQETAAAAAGMTERSARKWQRGPLPSETKAPRWWRTRVDPLVDV